MITTIGSCAHYVSCRNIGLSHNFLLSPSYLLPRGSTRTVTMEVDVANIFSDSDELGATTCLLHTVDILSSRLDSRFFKTILLASFCNYCRCLSVTCLSLSAFETCENMWLLTSIQLPSTYTICHSSVVVGLVCFKQLYALPTDKLFHVLSCPTSMRAMRKYESWLPQLNLFYGLFF